MATVERTHPAEPELLAVLRSPRTDIVLERSEGPDLWTLERGPFSSYRRTVTVADDGASVTERTEFKLAIPMWWPYLILLFKRALANTDREPRRRWWWPKEVVSADTSRLIGTVGTIGAMAGYMGVIIGQTITFASADFGVDDSTQANTLAATRIGVLLSMVLLGRADKIGRRPLTLGFAVGAIIFTAMGALAPNMAALAVTQMIGRGLTTGLLTLVTLAATEEAPGSARAMAIGFATLATGFGAALVVWVLPVAGLSPGGWRIVYLVPLLFLPLVWWLAHHLPETRRYTVADRHQSSGDVNWRRFTLIAATAFISATFASPASQLRNEYLRDDLGFQAGDISIFQLAVSSPATLAVPLGAHLADRYGRRWVGAITLFLAATASALSYQTSGWMLWALALVAMSAGSAAVPALRGYQTELFPTRARGRVGGYLDTIALSGSALGLVVVGYLATRWDDLGSAVGVMAVGPVLVVLVILLFFPETADRELEHFNPGDVSPDDGDKQVDSHRSEPAADKPDDVVVE